MSKEISQEKLLEYAKKVLENPLFIPELSSSDSYERIHDDHDGTFMGGIQISMVGGDIGVLAIDERGKVFLRFRDYFGGGQSPRVHNALRILALAIKLDNEEHPQS